MKRKKVLIIKVSWADFENSLTCNRSINLNKMDRVPESCVLIQVINNVTDTKINRYCNLNIFRHMLC